MRNRLGSRGVTLVEVMIALVILLIVFMGLIQASIVSINSNMRNNLRDEAVRLTSDLMSRYRAAPFDDINRDGTTDANPLNFTANQTLTIRNAAIPFAVAVTSVPVGTDHKRITIATTWQWQGDTITHTITSVRGR